jgi:hypothetical protein
MMPGATMEEICDALIDAYDPPSLTMALKFLMNVRLDVIIEPGAWNWRVFKLVEWADMNGRDVELVHATGRSRPTNAKVQAVYRKYGMGIPVYVQNAGTQLPEAEADTAGELEKIVREHLNFLDIDDLRDRLTRLSGRVCMVTLGGAAQGTGFLVGPDTVLTNYHVMEPVIKETKKPADVECVFDFKKSPNGEMRRTPVKLHPTDWHVNHSPYTAGEGQGAPDRTVPTEDELDYALIKLAEPVGSKPWAQNADSGDRMVNRGWVFVPGQAAALKSPMAVLIAQHPSGWPMKVAFDTDALNQANGRWLNANGTRVRYATNTLGGSSGSPVFDLEWNLIALHHYGDPALGHEARFNQGVPAHLIRKHLEKANKAGSLGDDRA